MFDWAFLWGKQILFEILSGGGGECRLRRKFELFQDFHCLMDLRLTMLGRGRKVSLGRSLKRTFFSRRIFPEEKRQRLYVRLEIWIMVRVRRKKEQSSSRRGKFYGGGGKEKRLTLGGKFRHLAGLYHVLRKSEIRLCACIYVYINIYRDTCMYICKFCHLCHVLRKPYVYM